jgi:hypothetical protein
MVGALTVGCDGDSGPAPVTAEGLTPAIAQAFCEQMRRCCAPADFPSPEWLQMFEDPACPATATVHALLDEEFNLARVRQSVQSGRATLDGAQARACADALGRLSCPNWAAAMAGQQAAIPDACRRMIRGTRPVGAPCQVNLEHECQSGSCSDLFQCMAAPTEGQGCPSRCEDVFDCRTRCAGELRCSSTDVCARNPAPSPVSSCDGA